MAGAPGEEQGQRKLSSGCDQEEGGFREVIRWKTSHWEVKNALKANKEGNRDFVGMPSESVAHGMRPGSNQTEHVSVCSFMHGRAPHTDAHTPTHLQPEQHFKSGAFTREISFVHLGRPV